MSEFNGQKTGFLTCRSTGELSVDTLTITEVFQYSCLHCVEIIYIFMLR
jgi:hypothetical protein